MRHWFLVLMIALLPLRGWVGDAMAVEMQAQPMHASMSMDSHAGGHEVSHTSDHGSSHGEVHAHCACDEQASAGNDRADHQHSACDVCNVPALTISIGGLQTPSSACAQLAAVVEHFASIEAQRGIKPPIS